MTTFNEKSEILVSQLLKFFLHVCVKKQHKMHFLPGEDPHVDYALMNHLILKCVWRSRGLIVGLSKTKNKQKKISN